MWESGGTDLETVPFWAQGDRKSPYQDTGHCHHARHTSDCLPRGHLVFPLLPALDTLIPPLA